MMKNFVKFGMVGLVLAASLLCVVSAKADFAPAEFAFTGNAKAVKVNGTTLAADSSGMVGSWIVEPGNSGVGPFTHPLTGLTINEAGVIGIETMYSYIFSGLLTADWQNYDFSVSGAPEGVSADVVEGYLVVSFNKNATDYLTYVEEAGMWLGAGFLGHPSSNPSLNFTVTVNGTLKQTEPTDPDAVPEPATLMLVGLGLAGLGLARRRK